MLSEKALKESYFNRILAILHNDNQKIYGLAKRLQLDGLTSKSDSNDSLLSNILQQIRDKLKKFNLFGLNSPPLAA